MITDARVLQPDFVPGDVRHRDAQVSHLSDTLRPITEGERAESSFLYGPSGVGKTCIARYTVEQLHEQVVAMDSQYVNCWEDYTRFKTLYRILDGIGRTIDIHRQSTPRDELLERLRNAIDNPYVVILDEVDQLDDKSVLYDLYRVPNLTMVLIANREENVFAHLDERLNSRLSSCARISFSCYSMRELVAILEDRVRWGLAEDAIDQERLELIADRAAGDARKALGILRNAAQTAKYDREDWISHNLIEDVVPEAKAELQRKTVEKLTTEQQLLYDIIVKHDEIGAGELYDRYCEQADDPKTQRMVRNYLSKLEQYNLIAAEGETKGRSYCPVL
jgi:orc1/cdc6 family replication initiation protein